MISEFIKKRTVAVDLLVYRPAAFERYKDIIPSLNLFEYIENAFVIKVVQKMENTTKANISDRQGNKSLLKQHWRAFTTFVAAPLRVCFSELQSFVCMELAAI